MPNHLLLISGRPEDQKFASFLAEKNQLEILAVKTKDELRRLLLVHPQALVLWDAENPTKYDSPWEILPKYVKAHRVFAVTDRPIENYPHLMKFPVFGHHILRRFTPQTEEIYARLAQIALAPSPFGVSQYCPPGTKVKKIPITRSVHKKAAIQAIQNYLESQGVTSRLAALVAQTTDELIMNAIFNAPVTEKGVSVRKKADRDADFELPEKEHVDVELAETPGDYIVICVKDRFGTLKKKAVFDVLKKHYDLEADTGKNIEQGVGVGLYQILQAGLSLLFASKLKECTEVMLFFPKARDFKSFRGGFRFLSFFAD